MRSMQQLWDDLVEYVLVEYALNGQDPNLNLSHDFAERKLRLRVASADGETWITRNVTDGDLRHGDLRSIARELYASTRLAQE